MAESAKYYTRSSRVFRGFPKDPIVVINRLNDDLLLKKIRVKCNINGSFVPYSADEGQESVLRNELNTSNNEVNINANISDGVSKDKKQKNANHLIVTGSKKKKTGSRRLHKKICKSGNGRKKTNDSKLNTKKFKCMTCNNTFKSANYLNLHNRYKHTENKYTCPHCFKEYKRKYYFEKHVELHCKTCFVFHKRKKELDKHMSTCKSQQIDNQIVETTKYTCNICMAKFDTKCILSYHIASAHSNTPVSIKDLYYIRIFDTIKVYVCYYCKDSSIDKDYLELHVSALRNMFTSNVKHSCDQCAESFNTEDNLMQHKLTHANPEPLQTANNETESLNIEAKSNLNLPLICNVTNTQIQNNKILDEVISNRIVENVDKTSANNITTHERPININDTITSIEKEINQSTVIINNNDQIQNVDQHMNTAGTSLLQDIKHEVRTQSTIQGINLINNVNLNVPINATPKKTYIHSNDSTKSYSKVASQCFPSPVERRVNVHMLFENRMSLSHQRSYLTCNLQMCGKSNSVTNFSISRHMEEHLLRTVSNKLCSHILSRTSRSHECVTTKIEDDCDWNTTRHIPAASNDDNNDSMDIDNPEDTPPAFEPQYPVTGNPQDLKDNLVIRIEVREVPIEF